MASDVAPAPSMSSVKLGLSTFWYAFWTAAPIVFVFALLFMAVHVHPWEGVGLAFLLLLSIPVHIWALGLVSKTIFLEKFRLVAPDSIGRTLYGQIALITLVCAFGFSFLQKHIVSISKSVTHYILNIFEPIPIAEKITIELLMWGTPATITLIIFTLIWLTLIGMVVKRQIPASQQAEEDYQGLIRRWDLMRVPADQPLMLTAMMGFGVLLVFLFWGLMPVTTPHPHEDYEMPKKNEKGWVMPIKVIDKIEEDLSQAEATIDVMEKENAEKGSKQDKPKVKEGSAPKNQQTPPAKKG